MSDAALLVIDVQESFRHAPYWSDDLDFAHLYAVWQSAHREARFGGPTPSAAAKDGMEGLQDWAASKTEIGLGFPLDGGPENTGRFSQWYTPIEWDAWQATRADFAGAHNVWVTVVERPRVSTILDDAGRRTVDLRAWVKGEFEDEFRIEQVTLHMTAVPASDSGREPCRLTGMMVNEL